MKSIPETYKLCKNSLNSDGQQFHQYQQSEQSSLTGHKQVKTMTYEVRNLGPELKTTAQNYCCCHWKSNTFVSPFTGIIKGKIKSFFNIHS